MISRVKILLAFCLLGINIGCLPIAPTPMQSQQPTEIPLLFSPTPNDPVPTSTLSSEVNGQVILADQEVKEFGWLPDGRIYYEIRDGEKSVWYAYDTSNGTIESIPGPHPAMDFFINKPSAQIITDNPGMDPDMYNAMTQNGAADLLTVALSPNDKAAIYTRLPIGFVRPTTEPHYIDPLDLWVVSEGGKKTFMVAEEFSYDCGGSLDPQSRWFFDETLMIGSCGDCEGYFFSLDLLNRRLHFISFDVKSVNKMEMQDTQITPSEVDVARQSLSLAFAYGGLWIVPVDKGVRVFPESLDNSSVYIPDAWILSPRWSADDQWVYYWRIGDISGYDENGFAQRPWWLEKINIFSKEIQVVLKPDELRAIVGNELYELNMAIMGDHMTWQLSPDGHQALLFEGETIVSPHELFLLSW
jgi:hypothetical protein